jgi:hypothetical protein
MHRRTVFLRSALDSGRVQPADAVTGLARTSPGESDVRAEIFSECRGGARGRIFTYCARASRLAEIRGYDQLGKERVSVQATHVLGLRQQRARPLSLDASVRSDS